MICGIFVDAAAALYAGAAVMQVLFPGVPLWATVAAAALIAGGYILIGGLDAVVLNDSVQAAVILVGGAAVALLTLDRIPSWPALAKALPDGHLHLMQPIDDPVMPWPGIFTGVLVVGIYFWCTNQFVIQRALCMRFVIRSRYDFVCGMEPLETGGFGKKRPSAFRGIR